jgi:Tol biopolymer transport system component
MEPLDFRQLRSLGLVLAAAGVCATAALAAHGAAPSRIVFAANRVALSFGEVYRVNPDGSRVDLSNSPAPDIAPAVSPDGKQVAFISSRGGHLALYVAGSDGKGLRRVSPSLFATAPNEGLAEIAWSGDSRRLAAAVGGNTPHRPGLYVADLRGGWRTIARDIDAGQSRPSWSPDGRLLAYTTNSGAIQVVSASGKRLWSVPGEGGSAWSLNDRLAVSANSYTINVYETLGHRLATFPGQSFAWAPTSGLLAVMIGKRLQLRPGGTGKPILDVRIAQATPGNPTNAGIAWVGRDRVRTFGGNGWVGYDIAHKRVWTLPAEATEFNSVMSPDGTVATQQNQGATDEKLVLLPPGARSAQVLQTAPTCGDVLPFASLQFVPHTQALIYQSGCQAPSADIYAVKPDGSSFAQLTNTPTDETQPDLSPDGSSVVYVQQQFAEGCKGCPNVLWRVSVNGGTPQPLTTHIFEDKSSFDDSPSWSPDGTKIAFERSGASAPPTLSEMSATGGPARSLAIKGINGPVWGPKLIAFSDFSVPRPVIKTYDPASGAVHTVLNDTTAGAGKKSLGPLAWSADNRLAYVEYDTDGRASISVIGSKTPPINLALLLPRASRVSGLAWSPDGTDFAFVAPDANGIGEVYTIGTDSKTLTPVTDSIGAIGSLSWR